MPQPHLLTTSWIILPMTRSNITSSRKPSLIASTIPSLVVMPSGSLWWCQSLSTVFYSLSHSWVTLPYDTMYPQKAGLMTSLSPRAQHRARLVCAQMPGWAETRSGPGFLLHSWSATHALDVLYFLSVLWKLCTVRAHEDGDNIFSLDSPSIDSTGLGT